MLDILNNIILFIFDMFYLGLDFIFGWISLPPFPIELSNSINTFLDLIFNNLSLIGLIIRPTTFYITIPILIIILNFELFYKIFMWILRKIPFLGIK